MTEPNETEALAAVAKAIPERASPHYPRRVVGVVVGDFVVIVTVRCDYIGGRVRLVELVALAEAFGVPLERVELTATAPDLVDIVIDHDTPTRPETPTAKQAASG